jgi:hypothetical protein
MKPNPPLPIMPFGTAISFLAVFCLAVTQSAAAPDHDPAALEVLRSVQGKLASSPTLSVEARRSTSWEDKGDGPVSVIVERPNRFLARQGKGADEKVLAYDGTTLRFQLPGVLLHAEGKLKAPDTPALADVMQERFGFRPPLAELLAPDLVKEMAREGATIRLGKTQSVGWTKCHHLVITQPGQTTEIWVGAKDSLPRRYRITFGDSTGNDWMDTRFKKWKFGVPTTPEIFRPAPAAGSHAVELLKSR